jgi:hypothetical protein
MDIALTPENMILTAINEGLSTCCVGSSDEKEVKSLLMVPGNFFLCFWLWAMLEKVGSIK